jgi:predicted transposase YdaD
MHEMAIYDFNTSVHVAKREGREEGKEEGRKEGKEEGRKEGRKEGKEEGRKEGIEEGRKEEQIKTVKRMRDLNISIKDIARATGITEQEVYNILNR